MLTLCWALVYRWFWLLAHCWSGWCAVDFYADKRLMVIAASKDGGLAGAKIFWEADEYLVK